MGRKGRKGKEKEGMGTKGHELVWARAGKDMKGYGHGQGRAVKDMKL